METIWNAPNSFCVALLFTGFMWDIPKWSANVFGEKKKLNSEKSESIEELHSIETDLSYEWNFVIFVYYGKNKFVVWNRKKINVFLFVGIQMLIKREITIFYVKWLIVSVKSKNKHQWTKHKKLFGLTIF